MSTGFGGELCTVTMGTEAGETLGALFCCFLPGLAEEEMRVHTAYDTPASMEYTP